MMRSRALDVRAAGELIGLSYAQARRLSRIHLAIPPIKQAVACGDLHARAAIELDRIHNAHVKSAGPEEGQRQTEELLDRILRERWSVRRIEEHAKRVAAAGVRRSSPGFALPRAGFSRPPVLVCGEGRVVIDEIRIQQGSLTREEREKLVAMIEDLLWRVRRV
jgi:hypothetical protein